MSMSDPIADMLTRIRNATRAKKPTVEIPASNMKIKIAEILRDKGFIKKFVVVNDNKQGLMKVLLKYVDGESSIQGIEKVSTPGHRKYVGSDELPKVLNGLGFSIISTSGGMKTNKECRAQKVGGEVICKVW
ncbi:MAG: 30S ribosomal protein S8 [Fibrobacterales bacterium]